MCCRISKFEKKPRTVNRCSLICSHPVGFFAKPVEHILFTGAHIPVTAVVSFATETVSELRAGETGGCDCGVPWPIFWDSPSKVVTSN